MLEYLKQYWYAKHDEDILPQLIADYQRSTGKGHIPRFLQEHQPIASEKGKGKSSYLTSNKTPTTLILTRNRLLHTNGAQNEHTVRPIYISSTPTRKVAEKIEELYVERRDSGIETTPDETSIVIESLFEHLGRFGWLNSGTPLKQKPYHSECVLQFCLELLKDSNAGH